MKILIIIFFIPRLAWCLDLKISGTLDAVYSQGLNQSSTASEKLNMRGTEISVFSPIDHTFNGLISFAAHDESGAQNFELHEGVISSSKLIKNTNIRLGKFFLGVGRLNRFHQHDWYFTTAPKIHRELFDTEGALDTGIESTTLLPFESIWNVTMGVTSGHTWGHSHVAGVKPKTPTHYSRIARYFEYDTELGAELGANYIGRTSYNNEQKKMYGLDFILKAKKGKTITHLVQSEFWFREEKNLVSEKTVGSYIYYQKSVTDDSPFFIGLRWDTYKLLDRKNILGEKENNIQHTFTLPVTYQHSEFSFFRLSFSHDFTRIEGDTKNRDQRLEAQIIYIIGEHPAHVF